MTYLNRMHVTQHELEMVLRAQRGQGTLQQHAIFHFAPPATAEILARLGAMSEVRATITPLIPATLAAGIVLVDQYMLVKEIRSYSNSVAFMACDTRSGRNVCIKEVRDNDQDGHAGKTEARALRWLEFVNASGDANIVR